MSRGSRLASILPCGARRRRTPLHTFNPRAVRSVTGRVDCAMMRTGSMPNATDFIGAQTARLTKELFQVRPEEAERTAILCGMTFCASAIQILGRTVRDTLFLARYEPRDLPWMFILYGAVSAVVALLFARACLRFRLERMLYLTLGVGVLTYAGAFALIVADVSLVYPAFYVWADVLSSLLILQSWAIASRLHTARDAKRLFGA